jgi:dihydropteroate synthase
MGAPGRFAGLALDRPRLMGIVNVTPDSFSDGGRFLETEAAIAHGRALRSAGADILDVGGESTRPGARPVGETEEKARVVPVIKALAGEGALVSIDSRHASVMEAALDAGARIVNDVTALEGDPDSLALVAKREVPVVLMHMRGDPGTMQDDPRYDDVVAEVRDYLGRRVAACVAAGIPKQRIAVDPGIGFGKTVDHNLALIRHLDRLADLDCTILLGVSRKSFIGALSKGEPATERLPGSLAAALAGVARGAHILRVHDVAATAQALAVWGGIG